MLWAFGTVMLLSGVLRAQDLSGNWQGTLQAGGGLRILLKVSKADDGWKAVMYSLDQGAQPMAASSMTVQGLSFSFTVKTLDFAYAGTLNSDRTAVAGSAMQGGQAHVLNLDRVSDENAWEIPGPPRICLTCSPYATPIRSFTVKLTVVK
jgi:hypothetical protein